jgi:hypothetical protein
MTEPEKQPWKRSPKAMFIRTIIGGVLGALVGFAAYKFIGCRTGTCPLTANPYVAMTIWGLIGVMMALGR